MPSRQIFCTLALDIRPRKAEVRENATMPNRYVATIRGQSLVEYALIIFLVTLVVIATVVLFGSQVASTFQGIVNNL